MFPSLSRRMNSSSASLGVRSIAGGVRPTCARDWTSVGQRLADGGEGLVEVGWGRRTAPPSRARRQAEGDPRLVDFLEGLRGRGVGRPPGLAALIEFLPRDRVAGEESVRPHEVGPRAIEARLLAPQGRHACRQKGDLVVDLFHRPSGASTSGCGPVPGWPRTWASAALKSASALTTAAFLMSTCTWYGSLSSWTSRVALLHAVIVIHQDPGHLARDSGRHDWSRGR